MMCITQVSSANIKRCLSLHVGSIFWQPDNRHKVAKFSPMLIGSLYWIVDINFYFLVFVLSGLSCLVIVVKFREHKQVQMSSFGATLCAKLHKQLVSIEWLQ